jgi:hypothetical protein
MNDNVTNADICVKIFGWKISKDGDGWMVFNTVGGGGYTDSLDSLLPDYTHDLNLVATLEDMLITDDEWGAYLQGIVTLSNPNGHPSALQSLGKIWRNASAQTCCNAIFPILSARKARDG